MLERHCIRRASLLFASTLCLVACSEPEPEPTEPDPPKALTCLDFDEIISDVPKLPVTYETEHLDIHVAEDRFLCAGSAIDYERHAQIVAGELGIEIQRRIPIYAMQGASSFCGTASACTTRDGVVFATPRSAYHELAHGVACEIRTDAPALLAEGLARSFEPFANQWPGNPVEVAEIETKEFSPYYNIAGHFVRWLMEATEPEEFAALYRAANFDEGVWAGLEMAYGATLAEDYAGDSPLMWIQHRQCADMPLLESEAEGGWMFEATLDCDDESTLGPNEKTSQNDANGSTEMLQSIVIEVPEPGTYLMERSSSTRIIFERCLDEHPMTEQEIAEEWVIDPVWFNFQGVGEVTFEHPGLWRVDVLHEHGPPVDVWVTITPKPD